MKKYVFFGAGKVCKDVLKCARKEKVEIELIVDNDSSKWGTKIDGITIYSPDVLLNCCDKYIVIVTVGIELFPEIRKQLVSMGGYEDNRNLFNYRNVFPNIYYDYGNKSGVMNLKAGFKTVKSGNVIAKLIINHNEKRVYRLIRHDYADDFKCIYQKFISNNIFNKYMLNTKISTEVISKKYSLTFEHEYIPIFNYIHEWSPKMIYEYVLFMIDFIQELDDCGVGISDTHVYNTIFHNGKFVFYDFDAFTINKTSFYDMQKFINNHILILLMFSEGLVSRAYMFLKNYVNDISIQDVSGYLSKDTLNAFNEIYDYCYKNALDGNIQACCNMLRDFVMNIKFGHIKLDSWNGYQNQLYNEKEWNQKQRNVVEMVRAVKPDTLLDIAGNMGWYEFILHKEVKRCIVADLDYECIDSVYKTVVNNNIKNMYPIYLNVVMPTLPKYRQEPIDGIVVVPQEKGAVERFKSEMVLALAVIHHLVFAQQLSFDEVIDIFKSYTTRYIIIEFIEENDVTVSHVLSKNIDFNWYTKENFESSLNKAFKVLDVKKSEDTRTLYLCEKLGLQ